MSRAQPVDWSREWETVWKADAANPWFRYQAAVYAHWLPAGPPARRVLKTDAFDEACGFRPLAEQAPPVLTDVAPPILAAARSRLPAAPACATDVRRLAFRDGAFDLVFSPSTLDHFDDPRDIDLALAELARVLRPGGRLLVTLDNPTNPILRLRAVIHRWIGPRGGLIPFPLGRTLSRRRLARALERVGLTVVASGWAVHAPRVLGLWLGEWAARRGRTHVADRLDAVFGRIERVASRLPTRALTGHFVVADCRRPPGPAHRAAAPRWTLAATAGAAFSSLDHRLRCAYLRRVPAPVLRVVDPPLRTLAATGRRAAAWPLYLRQEIARWSGPCAGGTARVVLWGKPDTPCILFNILFDGPPAAELCGPRLLPAILDSAAWDADLFIAETTPALASAFRRRGFLIVPGMVRFVASTADLVAEAAHPSSSLASNLKVVARAGYRTEIRPYTRELARLYYDRYLAPHALARFAGHAAVPSFAFVDRRLAAGFAIALLPPGRAEPDAIAFVFVRGRTLVLGTLGTRDGDPAVVRAGGVAALYEAAIRFADERGLAVVEAGRALPWRTDGVARFKWARGFRPIPDGTQTLEYAVRVLDPASAAARRLTEHGVFARAGRRILAVRAGGTLSER